MGFPDDYTAVDFASPTNRYQGTGNSWAVPVVRWIGERLWNAGNLEAAGIGFDDFGLVTSRQRFGEVEHYGLDRKVVRLADGRAFNATCVPERIVPSNSAVTDTDASEKVFISPVGCKGILRRAEERHMKTNPRLTEIMREISAELPEEEIERISRIQPRGAYSERYQAAKRTSSQREACKPSLPLFADAAV